MRLPAYIIGCLVAFRPTTPVKFEDQPWYPAWKKSIDRTTRFALDATRPNTPEWEAADREYQDALAAHRILGHKLR
jgi:hypothetical protein